MSGLSQDPAYSRLKDRLIASTGLAFYADRDETMAGLTGRRLYKLGLRDCSAYAAFLVGGVAGSAEMEALVAQLTIGETYFFRGKEQFAAIRDLILPEILERKQSSMELSIWSAGCANGPEPYSLAIMLARDLADRIAGWHISIHATDINRGFLAQAAEGKFRPSALRATSDEVKRTCFSNDGRIWTIHPRYQQWISFHYLNLIDRDFSTPLTATTRFDLILCRNVLLYFTPQVRRRLIGQFHQSLRDEGWLMVGAAESDLDNYKAFTAVNAVGAMLYQKSPFPRGQREAAPPMAPNPPPTHPVVVVQPTPRPTAGPNPPDMEGLRQLADRGDWQHAVEGAGKNASGKLAANMREAMDLQSAQARMEGVWRERADRLSQRPVTAGAGENILPILVVAIGKERYGIELPDVAEVLPQVRATPVPGAADVFAGVINVHGEIRAVLDLRRFLRIDPGIETGLERRKDSVARTAPARVILLRRQNLELGLQVDSVEQIRWIGAGDLQAAGNDPVGWSHPVKGSTKDRLMLLSTEALFAELETGVTA